MKSIQRPSKPLKQQPKSNATVPQPNPNPTNESLEQTPVKSQPHYTPVANEPSQQQVESLAMSLDLPQSVYTDPDDESVQQSKPQRSRESHRVKQELSAERFQYMRFLDCDEPVSRIIFECYHCQQGILSEYTGEPVMGEYKGRPSLIQVKIQCPNCEQTAIKLTTGEVLSTTAILSPWQQ